MASGSHHCGDCGLYFESEKSLEVHLQYHKENLISMWMNSEERSRGTGQPTPSPITSDISPISASGDPSLVTSSVNSANTCATTYSAPSPMHYELSPHLQSPPALVVPVGPSSGHSSNVSFPQSSPNIGCYYSDFSATEQQQQQLGNYNMHYINSIDDQYYGRQGPQIPRFHPYIGRSPAPTPSPGAGHQEVKVKEEQRPDSNSAAEILDLDSQKVLGTMQSAHMTNASLPSMWRPHEQYSSNTGMIISSGMLQNQQHAQNVYGSSYGLSGQPNLPHMGSMNSLQTGFGPTSPNMQSYNPQGFPTPAVCKSPRTILGLPCKTESIEPDPPNDFPSNVKRPKSFRCEDCNKWFTSHGHLKRHYNTTLHKNMSKLNSNGNTISNSESARPPVMSPGAKSVGEASTTSSIEDESSLTNDGIDSTSTFQPIGSAFQPPVSLGGLHSVGQPTVPVIPPPSATATLPNCFSSNMSYSQATAYLNDHGISSAPTMYHGHFSTNPAAYGNQPPTMVSNTFYPPTSNFAAFPLQSHQSAGFHNMGDFSGPSVNDNFNGLKVEIERPLSRTGNGDILTTSPEPAGADTGSEASLDSSESGGHATPSEGAYRCADCGKLFNRMCYLTQHRSTYHEGEKPFKCTTCGKRFPDEGTFTDHQSKHAGEKPYKCEVCPKQFNHKTDLRRHMCLHTGEKPFSCEQCGKGFIRKDHMLKHFQTHRKKAMASAGNQPQLSHAGPQVPHPAAYPGHPSHTSHASMPHPSHGAPQGHPQHVVAPPVY